MARTTLTLRVPPALATELRTAAAARGESVNAYATAVLGAAVDPDLEGSEAERLRQRLARAGLLASPTGPHRRPAPDRVARARRAAGHGRPLADLVAGERE